MESCENEVQAAVTKLNKEINETSATITTNIIKCKQTNTNIQTQITDTFEMYSSNTNYLMNKMTDMELQYDNESTELNSHISSMVDSIGTATAISEIDITAGLQGVINNLGDEEQRIEHNHEVTVEMYQQIDSLQNETVNVLTEKIENGKKRVHTFDKEEMKVYTPTGM